MPSDDYTAFSSGGALKLKGGKVGKPKKKKDKKSKSDLEKALATGSGSDGKGGGKEVVETRRVNDGGEPDPEREAAAAAAKDLDDGEEPLEERKTEAQRRHEEAQRKKLLKLAESASARPELLKTHKERVEELNTYLSKLSEHHDMPKIGPG